MARPALLPPAPLPPVTEHHLRAAFEKLSWPGLTYAQVMADPIRSKVVSSCAHHLVREEWEQTHQRTVEPVRRCVLGSDGHPVKWVTQMVPGHWVRPATPDLFNQPQT